MEEISIYFVQGVKLISIISQFIKKVHSFTLMLSIAVKKINNHARVDFPIDFIRSRQMPFTWSCERASEGRIMK